MITTSDPTEDIKIGDIVVNKYNRFSRGLDLKYRVIGFIRVVNLIYVVGVRVKYEKNLKVWVSFGKEKALSRCYKFKKEDYKYL